MLYWRLLMATFLERYQAGDRVAVWDELVALGEGVRHKLYYADAVAVAAETMRRARHNVELLIQRLAEAGYRFIPPEDDYALDKGYTPGLLEKQIAAGQAAALQAQSEEAARRIQERVARLAAMIDEQQAALAARQAKVAEALKKPPLENPDVFDPPNAKTAAWLKKIEKAAGGPMPISLRAWYEQVGGVSLNGSHPEINPRESPEPWYPADPLMVTPLRDLVEMLDIIPGEDGGIGLLIAPDYLMKANTSGSDPYTIAVPNACADARLAEEWHKTTFVKYLRIAFQWGGFPGWMRNKKRPREALAKLAEGLLPI